MAIDVDTIAVELEKLVPLEVIAEGLGELTAEERVKLTAQVAIAQALQEIAYLIREASGGP